MTISKITNAPTPNEQIAKTNEVVDFCNNLVIPSVGNGTITITQGGTTKGTFTANASSNITIDLDGGGTSNIPIGSIIPFVCSSSYTPENCLPCDGTQYSKSQFDTFYTDYLVSGNLETCTFSEYTTSVNTYGSCVKFALDTINQVFRVPLIKDGSHIQQALTSSEIGKSYNAGLPNIKGTLTNYKSGGAGAASGVFQRTITSKYGQGSSSGNSQTSDTTFDASLSNHIYGNSDTVQTDAVALRYFVVVANNSINESAMDWSSWATSLSGKANVDGSNMVSSVKNFDGHWIINETALSSSTAIGTYNIDLSPILPRDNYNYEIQVHLSCSFNNTGGTGITMNGLKFFTGDASNASSAEYKTTNGLIVIDTTRILTMVISSVALCSLALSLEMYRRIGTNS